MKVTSILALLTLLVGSTAFATDGYFTIGCGTSKWDKGVRALLFLRTAWPAASTRQGWFLSGIASILALPFFGRSAAVPLPVAEHRSTARTTPAGSKTFLARS